MTLRPVLLGLLLLPAAATAADVTTVFSGHGSHEARQPQLAVDPGGTVYLVAGVENTIHCAISRDGGATFEAPARVGHAGVMALGMRRGPRVAATGKAAVISAICGDQGKGRDGDLVTWRSTDGGRHWHGPIHVNTVPGSAREGLHGLAASPDGTVYAVWLDLRNKKSQVYGAASTDGGATWANERLVYASPDGSVCECCQPSVTFDARGGLHVMWRNHIGGERDMYLSSSADGGRTFGPAAKLGEGSWTLRACPMDGGGLAGDADGRVHTIWMRKKEIFACGPGEKERLLGKGEQGWAAAGPGGFTLVWIEARPGTLKAMLPGAEQPKVLAASAFDPVVAAAPTGAGPVVAAWEEGPAGSRQIKATVLVSGRGK